MATQSKAETVTLRLEQQIDSAADAAVGALGRLENQIGREERALGRLESSLVDAKARLAELSAGSPDRKAVAAFERQSAAVDALREKSQAALEKIAELAASGGSVKAISAAVNKAEQLDKSLAAAVAKKEQLEKAATISIVDPAAIKKQQSAIDTLTDRIAAQRDKIGALRDRPKDGASPIKQLTDQVRSLGERVAESSIATRRLGDVAGFLGSQLGISSSKAAVLVKEIAALGPYGAIAAAAILATVAAVTAFVSVIAKGISAAGEMRAELLKLQTSSVSSSMGMHWLFNATRESSDAAERLQRSINSVNSSSSLGRAKLAEYAAEINSVRFRGKDADTVLRAMSIAGSAGSDSMAKEVLQMARAYRFAGGSIDDLAKRVEQKLGRAAMAHAIAFDAQIKRLRENITWIFGGADIDPLLRAMNTILSLFNAGSSSANTMRDMVTKLVEWAIGGMLRMGIAILRAYIALRENEKAWHMIVATVKLAAFGFAAMAILTTVVVGRVLVLVAAIMTLQMAIAGAAVYLLKNLGMALIWVYEKVSKIGPAIIDGIANGITKAGGKVWAALKSVLGGAVANSEAQLKIKSPSRVFAGIGHQVPAGLAMGITANENAVLGATQSMTANMVESSAGMVANDSVVTSVGMTAPAVPAPPTMVNNTSSNSSSETRQAVFHNCNFGDNSEASIEQAVMIAFEKASMSGRAA